MRVGGRCIHANQSSAPRRLLLELRSSDSSIWHQSPLDIHQSSPSVSHMWLTCQWRLSRCLSQQATSAYRVDGRTRGQNRTFTRLWHEDQGLSLSKRFGLTMIRLKSLIQAPFRQDPCTLHLSRSSQSQYLPTLTGDDLYGDSEVKATQKHIQQVDEIHIKISYSGFFLIPSFVTSHIAKNFSGSPNNSHSI